MIGCTSVCPHHPEVHILVTENGGKHPGAVADGELQGQHM